MELFIFANANLKTFTNAIHIIKLEHPALSSVCLVCVDGTSEHESLSQIRACLGKEVEVFIKHINRNELHKRLPTLLADRANKCDRLLVDLLNGTKQMTAVLYASASLLKLEDIIYPNVRRSAYEKEPHELTPDDYSIEHMNPLTDSEDIGRVGLFDLLYYRDTLKDLHNSIKKDNITSVLLLSEWLSNLERAVNHYFKQEYKQCNSALGLVSEELVKELPHALVRLSEPNENDGLRLPKKFNIAYDCEKWLTNDFCEPLRGALQRDPGGVRELKDDWRWSLRFLATVDVLLNQLRLHRNFASHAYMDFSEQQDSAAALQTMIYLMQTLSRSEVFG